MSGVELRRFEVADPTHGPVPCALAIPAGYTSGPLCLFLYGGGGSRDSLADIAPLLDAWWSSGRLPPMVVATPDVGPWSFYLDDEARGLAWESFVVQRFVPHLRQELATQETGFLGISMGGYGALKIAFARSAEVRAVAAISPMLEPSTEATEVPLRNRYHYPPGVPAQLLGAERDAALYRRDHPVSRAREHADALRASELRIYIDAAGDDALHAHDGAEYLHRALWDLDVSHEYRLRRDADHVGPDLVDRLLDGFSWVAAHIGGGAPTERSEDVRALRAYLEPLRRAAASDETMSRRYGVLRDQR